MYPHEREEWPRTYHPYDREDDSSYVKPPEYKAYVPKEHIAHMDLYEHISVYTVPMGDEYTIRVCHYCMEPLPYLFDYEHECWVYYDTLAYGTALCHAACAPTSVLLADLSHESIMEVE
jgi:hypothetical protein